MRDIAFEYGGREYRIPATRAFAVGEQVEDIATIAEVASWAKKPRFHKIARCYGAMLRFAGASVSDEEIHRDILSGALAGNTEKLALAGQAINALLLILLGDAAPTESVDETAGPVEDPKKPNAS